MASKKDHPATSDVSSKSNYVKLTLKYTGNVDEFRAEIDKSNVKFDEKGTKMIDVAPSMHVLDWFVRGVEGQNYKIEIARPYRIKFVHGATLDRDRKDSGRHRFKA